MNRQIQKAGLISEAMLVGPEDESGPDLEVVESAEPEAEEKAPAKAKKK